MLDIVTKSYRECLSEANKIPIKDRQRNIPDPSFPIVRMQLVTDPIIGLYPHYSVVIHTGVNLALVSLQTNANWHPENKAQGYLYCHPTIETISTKEDNLLTCTLPTSKSPNFSLDLNEQIIIHLSKITASILTGKRLYHPVRFNCEKFVNYLISEELLEVDHGQND